MPSEDWRRYTALERNNAKLIARMEETERGAPLRNGGVGEGGITVVGGSIRILEGGNLEVDGDASFQGDTAVGGALDVSGDATFSGNVAIDGTLQLPAGIIGNEALANPLSFYADDANAEGFALSTERTTLAALNVTVPAGFTRAVVLGIGTIFGGNSTPALDYMRGRVYVDTPTYSAWGRELIEPLTPNNGSGNLTVTKQSVVAGLTGGQVLTVRVTAHSDFANLPARPLNGATISATVIWAR